MDSTVHCGLFGVVYLWVAGERSITPDEPVHNGHWVLPRYRQAAAHTSIQVARSGTSSIVSSECGGEPANGVTPVNA